MSEFGYAEEAYDKTERKSVVGQIQKQVAVLGEEIENLRQALLPVLEPEAPSDNQTVAAMPNPRSAIEDVAVDLDRLIGRVGSISRRVVV